MIYNIGIKIKEIRLANRLTQGEFAKKIGVVKSTISLYESEGRKPTIEILKIICEKFQVSADYLMDIHIGNQREKNYVRLPVDRNDLTDYQRMLLEQTAVEFSKANEKLPLPKENE